MARLALLVGLDPDSLFSQGIELLEDRCWVQAQRLVDHRIGLVNAMMTTAAAYVGNAQAYENYIFHQLGYAHPRRTLTTGDYMILNAIAAGSLKEVN